MAALMRDLVAPAPKLRVQIVDIAKRPRGKERVPEVLNLALDFPLLIAPARRTGSGGKVIVAGELEPPRMKPNGTALTFEHGTAKVVVDEGPCNANKAVMKGLDMPAQETLKGLIEREQCRDRSRIGQHHHEPGERPGAVADADGPKRAQSTCASSAANVVSRR